jgi:hypothetical protein
MKSLVALLLLACFGIILPTAASPTRVCLMQVGLSAAGGPADDCCPDCPSEEPADDPCCVVVKVLPDTAAPHPLLELPPLLFTEMADGTCWSPLEWVTCHGTSRAPVSIRGPTSPAAHRAVLGIWKL